MTKLKRVVKIIKGVILIFKISGFLDSEDEEIDYDFINKKLADESEPESENFSQSQRGSQICGSQIEIEEKEEKPAPKTKQMYKIWTELIDCEHISFTHTHCKEITDIYTRNGGTMEVNSKNRPIWKIPIKNYFIVKSALSSPFNPFIAILDGIPNFVINALVNFKLAKLPQNIMQSLPKRLSEHLLPHQLESVQYVASRNYRSLIADEMGLGKTLQAVAIACLYGFPAKSVLVMCPINLVGSWSDTFSDWTNISPSRINIMTKSGNFPDNPLTIATYPVISRSGGSFLSHKFDLIIADECHEFSNQGTKLHKQVAQIIHNAKSVVLLSGTPSLNRPAELFTSLNLIRPDIFRSFHEYSERYCHGGHNEAGIYQANGSSHLEELKILIEHVLMIRRQKEDVLTGLPPKNREHVMLLYNPSDKMTEMMEMIKKQKIGIQNGLQTCKKAQRGLVLECFTLTSDEKIEPVLHWLTSQKFRDILFNQKRKILIFAHHTKMIRGISEWLVFKKIDHIVINGETSMNNRKILIDKFKTEEECRIAVLGIETISAGVTLIEATVVVFAELMYVPATHLQAEDRVHRIGQKNPVDIYYLHAPGSVDDRVWEILERKLQILGSIISSNTLSLT